MSILNELASSLGSRSDVPNQNLAKKLAVTQNRAQIQELVDNLENKNAYIASDCIKVLYELGYLNPLLIKDDWNAFLKALDSRNNRLVWGGMIALGTIADRCADELFQHIDSITPRLEIGSVITIDNAVLVLAKVSAAKPEYESALFPGLLNHLRTCRAREIPQHAEKILLSVSAGNRDEFIAVLHSRMREMTPSQNNRIKKVIQIAEGK